MREGVRLPLGRGLGSQSWQAPLGDHMHPCCAIPRGSTAEKSKWVPADSVNCYQPCLLSTRVMKASAVTQCWGRRSRFC